MHVQNLSIIAILLSLLNSYFQVVMMASVPTQAGPALVAPNQLFCGPGGSCPAGIVQHHHSTDLHLIIKSTNKLLQVSRVLTAVWVPRFAEIVTSLHRNQIT